MLEEYTFPPNDPHRTFHNDYCRAVRRLFWLIDDNERYLVFSCLELLPMEFESYRFTLDETSTRIGSTGRVHLYSKIDTLELEEALAWYDQCISGNVRYPVSKELKDYKLNHGEFLQEPTWPRLSCSFREKWMKRSWICPRVHYLLQEKALDGMRKHYDNLDDIVSGINNLSGIDLSLYTELFGSIVFVAPNPLFKAVDRRLVPDQKGKESESIILQPRGNIPECELQAIIEDNRPSGLNHNVINSIKCGIPFSIKHTEPVERSKLIIRDNQRGTIYWSEPNYYIRSMQMDFGVIGATRVVEYAGSGRRQSAGVQKVETVDVSSFSIGEDSQIRNASVILSAGASWRRKASAVEEKWFRDTRKTAELHLQEIIKRAKKRLILLDNYITDRELRMFGLACGRRGVEICLLTSKITAKRMSSTTGETTNAEEMLRTLKQLEKSPETHNISMRVMKGYATGIHDRFIVVDDDVWFIGPSFSEFGIRGGLSVRLSQPSQVLSEILTEMMDDRSTALVDWISDYQEEE